MADSDCLLDADPRSSPEAELAHLISEISEDTERAGWHTGLEYAAWGWVLARPTVDFSRMGGIVRAADVDRMRALSQQIGGWVHWPDDADGVRFVPMSEWLKLYAKHVEKGAARR